MFGARIDSTFEQYPPDSNDRSMLHRDAPFGLARYRGLVEPLRDPEPRKYTAPGSTPRHTKAQSVVPQSDGGSLPEDVMVIIIAYLSVADILVVRRVRVCHPVVHI